jgi:hypothetical protein
MLKWPIKKRDTWNKCSYCGKFISIADFTSNDATRIFFNDWDYSQEEVIEVYENKCKQCRKQDS